MIPGEEPALDREPGVNWAAVGRGVAAAIPWLIPVLVLQLVLLATSDDPSNAWGVVFLALLVIGFHQAGARAALEARAAGAARLLPSAALAGLGAFAVWLPLRILIGVFGDSDRPLAGLGAGLALAVLAGVIGGLSEARKVGKARD